MFKDYKKYLTTSFKVYLFVLVIIFILKIVGFNYFGFDVNNPTIIKISNFITNNHLENIYYSITTYLYTYLLISLVTRDNSTKLKIYSIFSTAILIAIKFLETKIGNTAIITLIDLVYFILECLIYVRFKNFKTIMKNILKVFIVNIAFQVLSLYLRNINYYNVHLPFVIYSLLDLDYIIMLFLYQNFLISRGGDKLCGMEAILSLLKKINLKKSLLKLQKRFQNNLADFKLKSKTEKITIIIYFILSLIWNTLSVIVVLLVAMINDTFIECIFILTSFWLSKRSFGKAFHFDSMMVCFIVSNLTYFFLNRITTPLGISIFIPILLGVGLSYVTSKFVKKAYKPLYRGMPKDLFEETILQVTEKDSDKYKICYEFYVDKKSDLSLSYKYNYSVPGIRKIRNRINDKIKRL